MKYRGAFGVKSVHMVGASSIGAVYSMGFSLCLFLCVTCNFYVNMSQRQLYYLYGVVPQSSQTTLIMQCAVLLTRVSAL